MLNQDLKSAFDREGYVLIRQFLPPTELAELSAQLDRYIREIVPNLPSESAFFDDRSKPETLKQMQHMEGDPYFAEYRNNARWNELAQFLAGEPCQAQGTEWFNKPPCTNHPTPPHQDNYYFCLQPPNVLTLWLALDVVDQENGCLRYIPGSHRKGIRPHQRTTTLGFSQGIADYSDEDRRQEVPMLMQPGDILAHHGNTIHRADPNTSSIRHRRSFAMVMRGASCQRDQLAYERYLNGMRSQHQALGVA